MPRPSGRMVVANGTELNALDSGLSGPVVFDAQTGCVGVDPAPRISYVPGECEEGVSGFPLIAQAPGCRNPGDSPDRTVRTLIPRYASTGVLFGFAEACPAYPGASPEVTGFKLKPVEQADALEGTCPPAGIRLLGARIVQTECGKDQEEWHLLNVITLPSVPAISTETITDDKDSDTANDPYTFAIWEKKACGTATTLSLRSVPMAEFKRFVSALSVTATAEASKLVELPNAILIGCKVDDPGSAASYGGSFHDSFDDAAPYSSSAYKIAGQVAGVPANARTVQLRAWSFTDELVNGAANASVTVNGKIRSQVFRISGGYGFKDAVIFDATLDSTGSISFELVANAYGHLAAAALEILGYRT